MITHFEDYILGYVSLLSLLSLLQLQSQLTLPVSLLVVRGKPWAPFNSVSDSGLLSYSACVGFPTGITKLT